ncbi:hypothetical protein ACOME3_010046 [Neoechinorhynchus agilis]
MTNHDNDIVYVNATLSYLRGDIAFDDLERAFNFGEKYRLHQSDDDSSEFSSDSEIEEMINRNGNMDDLTVNDLDKVIDLIEKKGDGRKRRAAFPIERRDLSKTKRVDRQRRQYLPNDLQILMGKANTDYALGNFNDAIEKCKDLISKAPLSSEPYATLALIYNDLGERQKSFELDLLSAYLSNQKEDWIRMFNKCVALSEIEMAGVAITRAIYRDPKDIDLQFQRIRFLDFNKMESRYNSALKKLFTTLIGSSYCDERVLLSVVEKLIEKFEAAGRIDRAERALREVFQKMGNRLPDKEFDKLIDLEISLGRFSDVILLLLNTKRLLMHDLDKESKEREHLVKDVHHYIHIKNLKDRRFYFVNNECNSMFSKRLLNAAVWLDGGYNAVKHLVNEFIESISTDDNSEDIKFVFDMIDVIIKTEVHDAQSIMEILFKIHQKSIESSNELRIRYLKLKAEILIAYEHLDDAIPVYEEIMSIDPKNYEISLSIMAIKRRLGRTTNHNAHITDVEYIGKPTLTSIQLAIENSERM